MEAVFSCNFSCNYCIWTCVLLLKPYFTIIIGFTFFSCYINNLFLLLNFRAVNQGRQAHNSWWQNSYWSVSRVPPWPGTEVFTSFWTRKSLIFATAVAECQEEKEKEKETGGRWKYCDWTSSDTTQSSSRRLYVGWWGVLSYLYL